MGRRTTAIVLTIAAAVAIPNVAMADNTPPTVTVVPAIPTISSVIKGPVKVPKSRVVHYRVGLTNPTATASGPMMVRFRTIRAFKIQGQKRQHFFTFRTNNVPSGATQTVKITIKVDRNWSSDGKVTAIWSEMPRFVK
jgi:hypothetical protein